MSCRFDPERLSLYADAELGPAETSEVEGHLAACESCRELHARLLRLAELYRSTNAPVPLRRDFVRTTLEKLATVRAGRARRPVRRRRLLLGIAAAVAAALLVMFNWPSAPRGSAEGLLARLDADGWKMWAGPPAPIQEGCSYAVPSGPARIVLDTTSFVLREGSIVTIESVSPPRIDLVGGAVLVRNGPTGAILVKTTAGPIRGGEGAVFAIACPPPDDPRAIRERLRMPRRGALMALLLPAAEASTAAAPGLPLVLESIRGEVSREDGSRIPEGLREIRQDGVTRREPIDPDRVWWRRTEPPAASLAALHPDRPLLEVVTEALRSPEPEKRQIGSRLVETMGAALGADEIAAVESWLFGSDPFRREAAVRALATRGRVTADTAARLAAIARDPQASPTDLAVAVSVLAAADPAEQAGALGAATSADRPPAARLLAAWGLLLAGDPEGRTGLLALLTSPDEQVAREALESVPFARDVLPVEAWRQALGSASPAVRLRAAAMLGSLGGGEDVASLTALLADPREREAVRRAAAFAVLRLARDVDVRRLLDLVRSGDPTVLGLLSRTLVDLEGRRPDVVRALVAHRREIPGLGPETLVGLAWQHAEARTALLEELPRIDEPFTLTGAVQVLLQTDPGPAGPVVEAILAAAEEGSSRWRAVLEGMIAAGDRISLAAGRLAPLARERIDALRLLAAAAARQEVGEDAARLLREALGTSDPATRTLICSALACSGDPGLAATALVERLRSDGDDGVRESAAWALAGRRDPRGEEALIETVRGGEATRAVTLAALGALAELGIFPPGLRPLLESPDPLVALWAATASLAADPEQRPGLRSAFVRAPLVTRVRFVEDVGRLTALSPLLSTAIGTLCARDPSPRLRLTASGFAPEVAAALADDADWLVRLAAARTWRELGRAVGSAPEDVPPDLARQISGFLPETGWVPRPTLAGREDDDGALPSGLRTDWLRLLARAADRNPSLRAPGEDPVTRRGRQRLAGAARRAAVLAGAAAGADTDDSIESIYRGLGEGLRGNLD